MHNICDERLLNLTEFVLDFLPKKLLKEQEMVLNNYGVWVISGVMANKRTVLLQTSLTVTQLTLRAPLHGRSVTLERRFQSSPSFLLIFFCRKCFDELCRRFALQYLESKGTVHYFREWSGRGKTERALKIFLSVATGFLFFSWTKKSVLKKFNLT